MDISNKKIKGKYASIKQFSEVKIEDKKSIFIGWASPISSPQEAQEIINRAKENYPDSNHVAYAWVYYGDQKQSKYSDDGEPAKTAGFPLLNILEKNNLKNSLLLVIRYFGGTLLGTGGLVKNYKKAGVLSLEHSGLTYFIDYFKCTCKSDYSQFEKISKLALDKNFTIKNIIYSDIVIFDIYCPNEMKDLLINQLNNLTAGNIALDNLETLSLPMISK